MLSIKCLRFKKAKAFLLSILNIHYNPNFLNTQIFCLSIFKTNPLNCPNFDLIVDFFIFYDILKINKGVVGIK